MPPLLRYAWALKTQIGGSLLATILKFRPTWVGNFNQMIGLQHRRSLFELHAGRGASTLPTNLFLEEVKRPGSEKDNWFITSEPLINALGPLGQDYARPKQYQGLFDLSYVDPKLAATDRERALRAVQDARDKQASLSDDVGGHVDMKSILIRYLLHVEPIVRYQTRLDDPATANTQLDSGLLEVFDDKTDRWLSSKDLSVANIMDWAWILTADTSERAALRLTILARNSLTRKRGGRIVPQFVFVFLLRRTSIDARALEPLLIHAWRLMQDSEHPSPTASNENSFESFMENTSEKRNTIIRNDFRDNSQGMSERIFLIMIIRLLRRARKAWPAACESIVALLNRYLDGINFRKSADPSTTLRSHDIDQLTCVYNTILSLLSLPSSIHPFQSAIFQQRAQFSLLRRMNQFNPPLTVDKRGYQAVVKMQLMHKKTLKEREWAYMKAKSWPPWKEEKLGIDAAIGVEHGISRAKEALDRAEEAGYTSDDWDAAAGILSGWDTDGSPTIQTRSIIKHPAYSPKQTKESRQNAVWAARIRATRTLDEAWSCFLACRDQNEMPSCGEPIYHAMFLKVLHRPQTSPSKGNGNPSSTSYGGQALPGDGLEVESTPVSPREAIYVRQPPPSADELLELMKRDGARPSGQLLKMLLSKAWSFDAGIQCLKASVLPPQHLSALLSNKSGLESALDADFQDALDSIPPTIFAGYIAFLVRFAPTMSNRQGHDRHELIKTGQISGITTVQWPQPSSKYDRSSAEPLQLNPLMMAYKLTMARKFIHRPVWFDIFRALASPKAVTGVFSKFASQYYQDVKTWRMMCSLIDRMMDLNIPIDLDGFSIICMGLEKAIFASERQLRRNAYHQSRSDDMAAPQNETEIETKWEYYPLSKGLPLVKALFRNAVRSPGMQQDIPASITTEGTQIDKTIMETLHQDTNRELDQEQSNKTRALLPPACLLPRLLEVPHPAHLHAFIRVLGLRRDYDGIMDLVEWMSLFADEINALADEAANGQRMIRRCMTAIRVFLERSWMHIPRDDGCFCAGHGGIVVEAESAKPELVNAVYEVVLENRKWGGWASVEEVREYCSKGRFL